MRAKLYILLATLIAVVSCQKGDEQCDSLLTNGGVMRFTTSVAESRAGLTTDNLTEFGVSVSNSANSNYSYSNVYVSRSGSEWEADQTMLWQNENQEVTITAHAPYNSYFANDFTVEADQSSEEYFTASDHLFANSVVTPNAPDATNDIYYNDNGDVNVNLAHVLAKFTITFSFSGEFGELTSNPITSVSIGGTYLDGTIDSSSGEFSVDNTIGTITPYNNNDFSQTDQTVSYQAILIPQSVEPQASFSVKIVANGKSYTWIPDSEITFISGRNHNISLQVGAKEEMLFLDNNVTVQEWSGIEIEIDDRGGGVSLKSVAIGDLYPNDSDPIGVVFSVNPDGLSGKIVSLDESNCSWSTSSTATGATDETNGLANMRTILAGDSDFNYHPACQWVHSKNSETNDYADGSTDVWYLPSKEELAELHDAYVDSDDVLLSAISEANGATFKSAYYWSSTEHTEYSSSVWVQLFFGSMSYESLDKEDDVDDYARAILAF